MQLTSVLRNCVVVDVVLLRLVVVRSTKTTTIAISFSDFDEKKRSTAIITAIV